ncbi:unnamed protein product [Paramecium sonneborni]|uniref:Uncharacterized protein n=1 Tax=Paramecium sonneborni TaxID=65129 RepID=A0A8S1RRR7_9CILI|nr:unnamed protein product [Paramecium sonneborni]
MMPQLRSEYFQTRFQKLRPQNDNKKVDLAFLTYIYLIFGKINPQYLQEYLQEYHDCLSYLTDSDQFIKDSAKPKQLNNLKQVKFKLESNIKIITKQQKQQQHQLFYQQQLHNSETPSQQIEDMVKQFSILKQQNQIYLTLQFILHKIQHKYQVSQLLLQLYSIQLCKIYQNKTHFLLSLTKNYTESLIQIQQ